MSRTRARGGAGAAALGAILAITIVWWALALWPGGERPPEWLARTRLACFGAEGDALPNAGGWVLLIGEPLGMLAVLFAVWGDSVRRDLATMARRWTGRTVLLAGASVLVFGTAWVVERVRASRRTSWTVVGAAEGFSVGSADATSPLPAAGEEGLIVTLDTPAPPLALTDQSGRRFTLQLLRGRPVIVTFAYAHCETVCPTAIRVLRAARAAFDSSHGGTATDATTIGRPVIVVVSLDPWRDVAARLPTIAREWGLGADDRLVSGEIAEVERTLDAWGVGRSRDERTGEIVHATPVLLIDRQGRVRYRVEGRLDRVSALLATL